MRLAIAIGWSLFGENELVETYLIPAHIPYFIGGVMFFLMRESAKPVHWLMLLAATATLSIVDGWHTAFIGVGVFLVFWMAIKGLLRWTITPVTLWLGSISYSLYLTHFPIWKWFDFGGAASVPVLLAQTAMALVVATAMTYAVEKPVTAMLRNLYKRHYRLDSLV